MSKRYGDVTAVEDVTLHVPAGDVLALLGPSGCGKSTLLRMIAGLETPTTGHIHIDGRDVTAVRAGQRNVGMVFQQPATFPYLTVAENLAFGMKVRKVPRAARDRRVAETAELLGIGALLERRPSQLSGGERQRVEIGRALLRDPDVLLLDEPLTSLDAHLRLDLRAELARIQREVGTTMVVVTHDQIEATVLGTRVGVMRDGALIQVAGADVLYNHPANAFVARFVGSPPMNLLAAEVRGGQVMFGGAVLGVPLQTRDGPVTIGIRPTDLAVDERGELPVIVVAVEDQGSDVVCDLAIGAERIGLRLPRDQRPSVGTSLRILIRRWHLFDAMNGERIAT